MNILLLINLYFEINFSRVGFRFSTIKNMESITLTGLFFYSVLMIIVRIILIFL